ncbi:hypothetical protein ZOSMA_109G00550 [Zostera marina]|uniref:Uncharacterized protein n=1 Tax=Zostera marina TaxID=29655 RepID=A0A0K9Q3V7_ZOSMR|nr:hypothetical protein ZOSMA_109G00550 [Zostera marina]
MQGKPILFIYFHKGTLHLRNTSSLQEHEARKTTTGASEISHNVLYSRFPARETHNTRKSVGCIMSIHPIMESTMFRLRHLSLLQQRQSPFHIQEQVTHAIL